MQTVCEYRIVTGKYLSDVVTAVNEAIAESWRPIGGMFEYHHPEHGLELLCQAMVKVEETTIGYSTKSS